MFSCSKIEQKQLNTWVSFQSAEQPLLGQFSVSGNNFPSLSIDNKFLYRIFEVGTCYGGLGKMGTQLNLNTETVGGIQIGVPPDSEIAQILEFIDRQSSVFDSLVGEAAKGVELLQERRSALISAAVTGKIDVRNW